MQSTFNVIAMVMFIILYLAWSIKGKVNITLKAVFLVMMLFAIVVTIKDFRL